MRIKQILVSLLLGGFALACHAEVDLKATDRPAKDLARDADSKPLEMLKLMQLKPGMTVLDLLGGGGYFSELVAQEVGAKGKVILHNNKAYMPYVGKELAQRLADGRLKNVVRHDREVEDLELAENSLDAVFFVMGYHDMFHVSKDWKIDPQQLMGQVRKALKPGGLMLVLDHAAPVGSKLQHSQDNHRIDETFVLEGLAKEGFELVSKSEALRNPDDKRLISAFDPKVRGKTDRFVFVVRNKK